MIRNGMKRTATGAATLALAIGILVTAAAPAQAQYRSYDDRTGYNSRAQWSIERMRDFAFKLAYHNAYTDAQRDYDGRSRFGFRDMPGYQTDGNGYLAWMGNRDNYRAAYRKGYEAGFIDSIESRPRRYDRADVERVLGGDLERVYENDGGFRDDPYNGNDRGWDRGDWNNQGRDNRSEILRIAQQNGYRDGLRAGQEDRNRSRGFNPDRSSGFRDALAGFRVEYGNRDFYRQSYRDGFRKGYEEGFRSRGRFPRPF